MSNYRTIDLEQLAEVFKALGNSHRLRILVQLAACCHPDAQNCHPGAQCCGGAGPRRVGELGGGLEIAASTVSHHIKELDRSGVLSCNKRGKCVICCIDSKVLHALSEFFLALAGDAPLPESWVASTAKPQDDLQKE